PLRCRLCHPRHRSHRTESPLPRHVWKGDQQQEACDVIMGVEVLCSSVKTEVAGPRFGGFDRLSHRASSLLRVASTSSATRIVQETLRLGLSKSLSRNNNRSVAAPIEAVHTLIPLYLYTYIPIYLYTYNPYTPISTPQPPTVYFIHTLTFQHTLCAP